MKCRNCGAETEKRYCEHCGSLVNENVKSDSDVAHAVAVTQKKRVRNIVVIVLAVFILSAVAYMIYNNSRTLSDEEATKKLNTIYKKINAKNIPAQKGNVNLAGDDLKNSLPAISKHPLQVKNTTQTFIEIFSSPEKAGKDTDGWLVKMANQFNASQAKVNGKTVSVSIRSIDSGVGTDYIASKKYTPDAFSPSNELWGKMLESKGIKVSLVEKRLAGNVTGVLFSKKKYDELIQKYGSINLQNINKAVVNNEIAMGYTNPFASSSGLNYLVSTLCAFDPKNPLSDSAVSQFEKFQANIPIVAYTTLQMRGSAKSGTLDGFILEYQSYANLPDIKSNYIFTPFGVRHDSPVYAIGKLSGEKKDILNQFIAFCKTQKNQKTASDYGFNNFNDYNYKLENISGGTIVQAQKVWKEKKNGANDVAAVFVADISGSMQGKKLKKLKESLTKGSKYIGKENLIGLVSFSDHVNINLPIGKFDLNQRALFTGAVESMQANGQTAMFDGITVGLKMLMDQKEKNPDLKLMLFVLTDGDTNRGYNLNDVKSIIAGLPIPIYTIGYDADISVLESVSNINEAASINADADDVVYTLGNLFNAQM